MGIEKLSLGYALIFSFWVLGVIVFFIAFICTLAENYYSNGRECIEDVKDFLVGELCIECVITASIFFTWGLLDWRLDKFLIGVIMFLVIIGILLFKRMKEWGMFDKDEDKDEEDEE